MNIGNFNDSNGLFNFAIYTIKTVLKMIPLAKGTANTALFKTNNILIDSNVKFNKINIF